MSCFSQIKLSHLNMSHDVSSTSFYPLEGGSTPYDGLYVEAPPERSIFYRLQVYERKGISLVEVSIKG